MTKWIMILLLWICLFTMSSAQVGIGGGGGLNYPGISASELHNSRFVLGAGYDIFIRHRLIKITKDLQLNAKYSVSNYFSDIDLSRVGKTRFNFNYLSIEVLTAIKTINSFVFTGGAGLNLVNVTAVQDYFESNESMIIPSVIVGAEYWFNKKYNVFANFNIQFGEFYVNGQNLPVHGFRLQLGATMFFTE